MLKIRNTTASFFITAPAAALLLAACSQQTLPEVETENEKKAMVEWVAAPLASEEPSAAIEAAERYRHYSQRFGHDCMLTQLINNKNATIRKNAILALYHLQMDCELRPLRKAIDDPEWEVRRAALRTITKLKPEQALLPILLSLKDAHWQVRAEAVECLSRTGTVQDTGKIIAMVKDDDDYVRYEALKGLQLMQEKFGNDLPSDLADAIRLALDSKQPVKSE